MTICEPARVGYVLKVYPRYSETFVVTEILAHEAAGLPIEIFSLRSPNDTHFQNAIARVRAPVTYIPAEARRMGDLWEALEAASREMPDLWSKLEIARGEEPRDIYQAVLLAQEARRRGIRHLHAHFASVATTVTRLAARFADLPYTFTAHAKDIFHESVRHADLRRKLTDANAVVTVSDYNVQHLRKTFGAAAASVQRIYNGLELEQFSYEPSSRRAPRLIAVGRLIEKKGFADLIKACALLRERYRDFRCEIIGAGPLEAELRARIEQFEAAGIVELLGPRPQSEVIRHVRSAAVFVAPCVDGSDGNRDGLPTVLLEAMALGTPCISTDVTGIPEVIRHRETGLLVAQRDPSALAAAIHELLTDRELAARLATRARQLIATEFDIHRNTAHMRDLFGADTWTDAAAA